MKYLYSVKVEAADVGSSLREKIGVVPQDPMLFNDSVMNNIRYARLTASDEEIYEACKAAAIHEKIMSFPEGECCAGYWSICASNAVWTRIQL